MLRIDKKTDGGKIQLSVTGRIDSTTAPEFEEAVDSILDEAEDLVFDFTGLAYISSAGLRVILKAQKAMNTRGSMKLIGVNDSVMEVFDITGFLDILTIA